MKTIDTPRLVPAPELSSSSRRARIRYFGVLLPASRRKGGARLRVCEGSRHSEGRSPPDLRERLANRQRRASPRHRRSGVVIGHAGCPPLPREQERALAWFLQTHPRSSGGMRSSAGKGPRQRNATAAAVRSRYSFRREQSSGAAATASRARNRQMAVLLPWHCDRAASSGRSSRGDSRLPAAVVESDHQLGVQSPQAASGVVEARCCLNA